MKTVIAIFILGLSSICASSSVADVVYGDFAGATIQFNNVRESSPDIPVQVSDLFGAPVVSGNDLVFTPQQFEALQEGTGANLVDSQLSLTIEALAGFEITSVTYSEFGDYRISTPFPPAGGEAAVSVAADGFVTSGGVTQTDGFDFTDSGIASAGSSGLIAGPWSNSFTIDVEPTTVADLTLNNTLIASALTATDSALVDKKGVTITITTQAAGLTTAVPEPSSFGLVILTAAGLIVRRKRRS